MVIAIFCCLVIALIALLVATGILLYSYRREIAARMRLASRFEAMRREQLRSFSSWAPKLEESREIREEIKTLVEEKRSLEADNHSLHKMQQDLDRQKDELIEANLKLLELKETLDDQKFKLAEANLSMLELTEQLREEQEKSDRLLRNILPARVIRDLQEHGESAPECFDHVTVFFSDVVGFTTMSSTLSPKILIQELNDIFTNFDQIFVRNGCERIKTIGDAYLSVSGMPEEQERHWANILNSAKEALQYITERNARPGAMIWQMRMGVHSGPVVGGIVGVEKYIYDVFGDTINTAARMEANSEPMRINVSEATWKLAQAEFQFEARPPIEVKGKGLMRMFFLVP